jgi:hypothetical protein
MKFTVEASVHFAYDVVASDEKSAIDLLNRMLGENLEGAVGEPGEIVHPQIETGPTSISVGSLGPVRKVKSKRAARSQQSKGVANFASDPPVQVMDARAGVRRLPATNTYPSKV